MKNNYFIKRDITFLSGVFQEAVENLTEISYFAEKKLIFDRVKSDNKNAGVLAFS